MGFGRQGWAIVHLGAEMRVHNHIKVTHLQTEKKIGQEKKINGSVSFAARDKGSF